MVHTGLGINIKGKQQLFIRKFSIQLGEAIKDFKKSMPAHLTGDFTECSQMSKTGILKIILERC